MSMITIQMAPEVAKDYLAGLNMAHTLLSNRLRLLEEAADLGWGGNSSNAKIEKCIDAIEAIESLGAAIEEEINGTKA